VRLKDVAERAGVDTSTASRVLGGRLDLVRPETAKRVVEASKELGYTPNVVARGLRTRRTHSIAVVLPDFSNPVYAPVIDGIEERAAQRGLSVLIQAIRDDKPEEVTRLVSENRVDGLLFAAAADRSSALRILETTTMPCVLLNRSVPGAPASVVLDEGAAVETAIRFLVGAGHTRIAYVSGPPDIDTARRRRAGFFDAMGRLGLRVDERLVVTAFEPETAHPVAGRLLDVDPPPTAIFTWTIKSALGVLSALHDRSIAVPGEISLIAMPDVWLAAYVWPPLTTVEVPLAAMGSRAVDLLAALVAGEPPERVVVSHPRPRIVNRGSVGPPA
jgi:LacI family transcriptional regulator